MAIGAMLGLYPNGLWTILAPSLLCATLSPTSPQNMGTDDVAASNGHSHLDDIDDSASSNTKGSPPPSALSSSFFRVQAAPLEEFMAKPTADDEWSDSDETVVETEDKLANPKTFIPSNVRTFSNFLQIVRASSQSTDKRALSQPRRGRSFDGRGVRLLPLDDDPTVSSPLQRQIPVLEDVADGSERDLAFEMQDVGLARLRDTLAQREVDYKKLQETLAQKDETIAALQERLDREEHQCRKLRRKCQIFRSATLPQYASVTQRSDLRVQFDLQRASKQPLDMPTREWYEYENARLRDRLAECSSLLSAARSPVSEGTIPVPSPIESRHLPMKGNQKVRAPSMRYSVSV